VNGGIVQATRPAAPVPGNGSSSRPTVLQRGRDRGRGDHAARLQRALRIVSPFLLLLLWEASSRIGLLDARFFPPPSAIAGTALEMAEDGSLLNASLDSLRRLALGYGIGAAAGVVLGFILGLSGWLLAMFEPWIQVIYPVPKLAIYPLLVLIVGLGDMPIIILLAIAVFYFVAINTIAGVLSISPVIRDVGRDCAASFMQSFRTIALPASLPHIFTGLEIALGIGYIVLIAGEFVGAKSGLGYVIWSSWQVFDVAPMYVAIVTVSLLGFFSTFVTRAVGNLLMPWRGLRK
jgi:NitT/TauT family transport system permease protein